MSWSLERAWAGEGGGRRVRAVVRVVNGASLSLGLEVEGYWMVGGGAAMAAARKAAMGREMEWWTFRKTRPPIMYMSHPSSFYFGGQNATLCDDH